ncbi:MAG: substrate-binding domain-containing protein, partial [Deinococcus sp.]
TYTLQDGAEVMRTLLVLPAAQRPTALLAVNDPVAVGAAHVAIGAGLRIPADLSLVGFDDIPLAAAFSPALTTVTHRYDELAALVLEATFQAIRGEVSHFDLEPQLIVRGSTAPPLGWP